MNLKNLPSLVDIYEGMTLDLNGADKHEIGVVSRDGKRFEFTPEKYPDEKSLATTINKMFPKRGQRT